MSRKLFSDPISLFLILSIVLLVPFWMILDFSEPQPEGLSEIAFQGKLPMGFQWNSEYQTNSREEHRRASRILPNELSVPIRRWLDSRFHTKHIIHRWNSNGPIH